MVFVHLSRPPALPLLILAALLVSCGVRPGGGKRITVYERGKGETELTLENEALLLRFIPGTAEILVTNKSTGTVWRTNPADAAADPGAEPVTRDLLQSQFILTYTDDAGLETTFSSRRDSVQDGRYEYALVNNGVEVSYTAGNVARTYYIPSAAPEERLAGFLEKMSAEERSAVESSYRLYDINRLYSSDNKSDLLVKFPDLEKTRVYALQENTRDYVKENLEQIFQAAGYTVEDYEEDAAHYHSLQEDAQPVFNVTLRYELDGPSLLVSVPFDRIAYRKEYPLTHLNLLPYFGAGGREDEGYLVVPDGSGALIDFNNGRQNQNPYISPVYGWDDGQARLVKLTDNRANFPAFGIQKNGEA
ncbi:MAG: DUF5696 domain-containing protein, partial [Treponema sp.]|nr:DUF5696 domain-containing protein [Treponema sp.]